MKIKDVMTKEVTSINPQMNTREALDLLFRMQISGLPVIDSGGNLIGMFTEKEFLAAVLPTYIDKVGKFVYEQNPKAVKRKAAKLDTLKVEDVMRREVVTVDENAALCEVAHLMIAQKARRVPVLGADKKVVGMAARGDVLKAILQEDSPK